MNIEILQMKQALAALKKERRDLDMKASGDIILIRQYLNPYEDDVTNLETEKALAEMTELHSVVEKIKVIDGKIKKMKKELGEE